MNAFSTFVKNKSFVHDMNPSLKLIAVVFIVVMIFLPIGFLGQIVTFILVMSLWFASKLPWRMMKNILKSIFIMMIILFVINWIAFKTPAFLQIDNIPFVCGGIGSLDNVITNIDNPVNNIIHGDHHFMHGFLWGGNLITDRVFTIKPFDALWNGAYNGYSYETITDKYGMHFYLYYQRTWYCLSSDVCFNTLYIAIKIFLMITIVSILTSTTTPVQLTFAIEDVLSPLRYIKVPVNEWSMTISIAIRFVPSLLVESEKILKAQASRGVDFSYGNFKDKIKALVSLVVPMFSVAFHKADDLANAMEARSYNPRYARTRYRSFSIKWYEWILFTLLAFMLGFMIMMAATKCVFAPFNWAETITIWG